MFDKTRFDNMPAFNTFKYWFIRSSEDTFRYGLAESFMMKNPMIVGELQMGYTDDLDPEVVNDFTNFLNRPEFTVGSKITINPTSAACNNVDHMVDAFEDLIVGFTFIRALRGGKDPDTCFNAATRFLDWIRSTDFYTCPGSTRFHDAEPNGLLFHTLNVYNNIVDLHKLDKFKNTDYSSITIISLCHDLTKIGNYESYLRNVKNEQTGEWEKVPSFRWKDNPFPFGHGVASMYIVSQFFNLTMDEMIAIRWHMAEYRVAAQEMGELEEACERYPIVRMVQFADQLACVKY